MNEYIDIIKDLKYIIATHKEANELLLADNKSLREALDKIVCTDAHYAAVYIAEDALKGTK